MKYYYQVVRSYGKHDVEYTVYQARKDEAGNIEISDTPIVLVGNHPDEIIDTLNHVEEDMKTNPVVDKMHTTPLIEDEVPELEADETYTDEIRNKYVKPGADE